MNKKQLFVFAAIITSLELDEPTPLGPMYAALMGKDIDMDDWQIVLGHIAQTELATTTETTITLNEKGNTAKQKLNQLVSS